MRIMPTPPVRAPPQGPITGSSVNFGLACVPELPAPARGGACHLFAPGTSASAAGGP